MERERGRGSVREREGGEREKVREREGEREGRFVFDITRPSYVDEYEGCLSARINWNKSDQKQKQKK